ncbi:hypothetical protein C0989_009979 [Termitomyces sp. Mn162]|nr:hypothetical protein C0989_009979 [Termitomyces sp. Mn162]
MRYTHYALCNEVPEDVIHHCLEGGWAVGESEEHNKRFKQSPVGLEGSLLFIFLLDMHIVVAPPDVQFSEVLHAPEVIDELRDEREGVVVLHHHGIENPIVLDQLKQAIFLLDEEDRRSHQRLERAYATRVQILLQEGVKLVLLPGC